jgi:hypothetical protein
MKESDIYVSLAEARALIKERWANESLRKKVEYRLSGNLIPELAEKPRAVLWRSLPSPDNGFTFFLQAAHWIGLEPFLPSYIQDNFVTVNDEKKGLARLSLTSIDGAKVTADILDWKTNEGLPIDEVRIRSGETLADFHLGLFDMAGYSVETRDLSEWWKRRKPAHNYYYYYLQHFIAHGILFEAVLEGEDARHDEFTNSVIYPNLERIQSEYGLKPLIVQLYPLDQTPEEDFYWFSYPPHVNDYLVKWALENNLPLKPWRPKK